MVILAHQGSDIEYQNFFTTRPHAEVLTELLVIGGGDSITATNKYQTQVSYICTGGGALIRFLSGVELPVVRALRHGSSLQS